MSETRLEAVIRENEFNKEQLKKKGISFADDAPGATAALYATHVTVRAEDDVRPEPELSEAVKIGIEAGNINLSKTGWCGAALHARTRWIRRARGAVGHGEGRDCAPRAHGRRV